VPKSHIYRIIRGGEVRMNKKRAQVHSKLCAGDRIRIPPIRTSESKKLFVGDALAKRLKECIIFEDSCFLVINKPPITALIREGQELLIQVDKEERGNKGAALTTFITLAGCYLVLMPNNPHSGGISRRIEGDDRDELRETLNALTLPEGMGLIIRTAGVGKSQEELQDDLDMLCNQWEAIKQAYTKELAPCLIHQEGNIIIRSIRDNLRKSIGEIIIDDHVAYIEAMEFLRRVKPELLPHLKLYNSDNIPLFNLYQIESQIETAFQRQVMLPSGGALFIDRTEALVSIDVNSAKATGGSDIETTAFNTNIEAANEIARQLRLRDLGGLIVIDFIDMSSSKNQRDVENRLKEALQADRARIQVGRISRFGLLEMSRQRLRLSLGETAQEICPRCEGRGTVRNIQSYGLSITRLIEEEALKEKTAEVQVQLPPEMATFIMNEKRSFIRDIEKRHRVSIVIIANPYLQAPQYTITRLKEDNVGKTKKPSYSLIQQPELELASNDQEITSPDEPAVRSFTENQPAKGLQASFIKRIWVSLFGTQTESSEDSTPQPSKKVHDRSQKQTKPNRGSGSSSSDRRPQNNRRRRPSGNQQQRSNQGNSAASSANPQHQHHRRRPNQQHTTRTGAPKNEGNKRKEPAAPKETEK